MSKKFLFLIFFSGIILGAAGQGAIHVSVYDNTTGESLIGASVVIAGTTHGGATDLDGKAVINNLSPGLYDVQVSYVTFHQQVIKGVEVSEDAPVATLEVRLKEEEITLSEVVVEAKAMKNSEGAMLALQKKSSAVLDGVSADLFSKTGDGDAAAAVRRVVGVTIESGKYVYVRGLGDRYSKSTLNGADMPGLDPNRNAVQLDLFPSHLIDNLVVYKAFTPDLPGDFSGGLVNMSTKDFPDRFTFQANASTGINFQSTFAENFITYNGGRTDYLGMDDGSRALPARLKKYNQVTFPSESRGSNPLDIEQTTQAFRNREFTPNTGSAPVNHSLSLSLGNQYSVFGKKLGFVAGVSYSRDIQFYDNGRQQRWSTITGSTTDLTSNQDFDLRDKRSLDEVTWGGLLNVSLRLNSNHKVGVNLMRNQHGEKETRMLEGLWSGVQPINPNDFSNGYQSRVLSWNERSLSNGQVHGEHTLPGLGAVKIDWLASYILSVLDQPDLRFLQSNYRVMAEGDTLFQITNKDRPSRFFRNMNETTWDNKVNVTVPFELPNGETLKFKTGVAYMEKEREYREDVYQYYLAGITYDGNIDNLFTNNNLALNQHGQMTGATLELFTNPPNNYDAFMRVLGTYLMTEIPLTQQVRVTAGMRYEATKQHLQSFAASRRGGYESNNLLPAINVVYELKEDTKLRASYSKTLARPNFRESAPLSTFAFFGDNNQNGNPDLVITRIDNFDLRWETYPGSGEYMGVSAFYKLMDNPIENTFNPNAGGSLREFTYENVPRASVIGMEVEFRKGLGFIAPILANFRVGLNATIMKSKVNIESDELTARRSVNPNADDTRRMFNQSPLVINVNLLYDNYEKGISSVLSFNMFGERLKFISADLLDIYEKPRPDLNFTIKKNFGKFSTKVSASNLLNSVSRQVIKFKGMEYDYSRFTTGISTSVGVSYLIE